MEDKNIEIETCNTTETQSEETQSTKIKLHKLIYVFWAITGFFVLLLILAINIPSFADFFNRHVSSIFRGILATVTNIFPLSLAELITVSIPILLILIIRFALKKYTDSWRHVGIFCISALSLLGLFLSLYILTFGVGYHTSTLDKKLELDKKEVSKEELAATAEWLIEIINENVDGIEYKEKSFSVMPHSLREMNIHLLNSYDSISNEYKFIPKLRSYVKPIVLSEPMTYTHITGVYTFFTGEANINTNSPDYCIPFTAAHELAHQRGIAREDEANFVAFLVCSNSDDQYIRYCGYLNLCEYVLGALYQADPELYKSTCQKLDARVIYEMRAYSDFYKKYQDNIVGEISGTVNNIYLQINGTEGTRSYGLVVDLAVAYYKKNIAD